MDYFFFCLSIVLIIFIACNSTGRPSGGMEQLMKIKGVIHETDRFYSYCVDNREDLPVKFQERLDELTKYLEDMRDKEVAK